MNFYLEYDRNLDKVNFIEHTYKNNDYYKRKGNRVREIHFYYEKNIKGNLVLLMKLKTHGVIYLKNATLRYFRCDGFHYRFCLISVYSCCTFLDLLITYPFEIKKSTLKK